MDNKVLVAYASRAGATAEVAEEVGKVLAAEGLMVDVLPVQKVVSLEPYGALVLGSAARIGRLIPETMRFARKFSKQVKALKVVYFVSCLTMYKQTPEARTTVMGYLKPLVKMKEPLDIGLFGGAMVPEKIPGFWSKVMKNAERGDYRDWDLIREWAKGVAEKLKP